jgi:hypothetical protein
MNEIHFLSPLSRDSMVADLCSHLKLYVADPVLTRGISNFVSMLTERQGSSNDPTNANRRSPRKKESKHCP